MARICEYLTVPVLLIAKDKFIKKIDIQQRSTSLYVYIFFIHWLTNLEQLGTNHKVRTQLGCELGVIQNAYNCAEGDGGV